MSDFKVYYIAGAGRSGSTMLDAVLGNCDDFFSCGELINFTVNGLEKLEYCSCGVKVPNCEFWSKVAELWDTQKILTLDQYNMLLKKYLGSSKRIHKLFFRFLFPNDEFKFFINDTKLIYESIHQVSNSKYLIDSSKNPMRLLLLRKIGIKFETLHLVRRLDGVIDSNKKRLKKDLKAGVELEIYPKKTYKIVSRWLVTNFLCVIFSKSSTRNKVKYEDLIHNPKNILKQLVPFAGFNEVVLDNKGPFYTNHIVAGNKMRMNKKFTILPQERSLQNLSGLDKYIAKVFNLMFYK